MKKIILALLMVVTLFPLLCQNQLPNPVPQSDKIAENCTIQKNDIKVAIYSGSFDPPTLAHNHIIRETIKYLNLDKLYIFVNKNGAKNYKCSIKQRVEMLECMLSDIKDKVIIIDQCADKKHQDYLMLRKCLYKSVFCIIGYDSYVKRMSWPPHERINFDAIAIIPRAGQEEVGIELEDTAFILPLDENILKGVSSTEIRSKLAKGDFDNIELHQAVLNYIIQNKLYQNNIDKRTEFEQTYYAFIGKKFVTMPLPPFDPQASVEAWEENFHRWCLFNKPMVAQ